MNETVLHCATVWVDRFNRDLTVFFEVSFAQLHSPDEVIDQLLGAAWHIPNDDYIVYAAKGEAELLNTAITDESEGDLRLFETGVCGGLPVYAEPDRTLMFVGPDTLVRLLAAQRRLPVVIAQAAPF